MCQKLFAGYFSAEQMLYIFYFFHFWIFLFLMYASMITNINEFVNSANGL